MPVKQAPSESVGILRRRGRILSWWVLLTAIIAVGVWRLAADDISGFGLAYLAGVLLAIGVLMSVEPLAPPRSRGLDGVRDGARDLSKLRLTSRVLTVVLLAVIFVMLVLSLGVGSLALYLLIAAALVTAVSEGAVWLGHGLRMYRAISRYRPTVALAYAGRSGGPWQLRMWEPFVLESGERCLVINRHEKYSDMIWEGANLSSPMVDLGPMSFLTLPFVATRSIKAMFYVQNAQSNQHYMRLKSKTHVWLNHGDSDKPANFNPRHAHYDVLVVTGEAAKERYARAGIEIPDSKFAVVGRPQIRGVDQTRRTILNVAVPRVLYAPTWAGIEHSVNFSSLKVGPQIVEALVERGVEVVFRPHPLSRRGKRHGALIKKIETFLAEDSQVSGRQHVWGDQSSINWTVVDCANHVDALISDVSSVVSDFLPSGKPYAMTMMRAENREAFIFENSLARGAYLVEADLANLSAVLDDMLGADPLENLRIALRTEVLSDRTGEQAAAEFAQLVRDLVHGAWPKG